MGSKKAKKKSLVPKLRVVQSIAIVAIGCVAILGMLLFFRKPFPQTTQGRIVHMTLPTPTSNQWCSTCIATALRIDAINFSDANMTQVTFDAQQKTWPTPVSGIATTQERITDNIIIFGHSKWFGKQYAFADISKLKPNDLITVTDQFGHDHLFRVAQLALADRNNGDAVHVKKDLQLTLLTSARYNGEWLLPTDVDKATVNLTKSDQDYAIFVVTAKPI